MPVELRVLVLAALWQFVQITLMSVPANRELGAAQTLSPRDRDRLGGDLRDRLSPRTARLHRAMENHFEALLLFAIAAIAVVLADASTAITRALAWTYLGARILYVPAYAFGWVPWRSAIWLVGAGATALMLASVLI